MMAITTRIEFHDSSRTDVYAFCREQLALGGRSVALRDSIVPEVTITVPEVGDRATYAIGSDCYPGTITKVTRCSVTFRFDGRDDERVFRLQRKGHPVNRGRYRGTGGIGTVTVGFARGYFDPSF